MRPRLLSSSALAVLAACAAPQDSARRDSVDTLPPSVVRDSARAAAGAPTTTSTQRDTATMTKPTGPRPEAMPNVAREDSSRMPTDRADKGTAPMPNATPPTPAPPASRPAPPTRVVPDPVLPPRDSLPRRP